MLEPMAHGGHKAGRRQHAAAQNDLLWRYRRDNVDAGLREVARDHDGARMTGVEPGQRAAPARRDRIAAGQSLQTVAMDRTGAGEIVFGMTAHEAVPHFGV